MTGVSGATDYIELATGGRVAYLHLPGNSPGVLFCTGFNSNMRGTKALALQAWCAAQGRQYTRFDYTGHGESSGKFEDGTISQWRDDALAVLDRVTDGPQVIVGSSMGGWIMLLMTLARPEKVTGLVGIATAADFTESLRTRLLSKAQRRQLEEIGYCEIPNCYDDGEPYRIGQQLLDEGRQHLLLDGEIPIDVPVRLIQGQLDDDVPWAHALRLMDQLRSADVELQLIKSGDHRLSNSEDLARLTCTLDALLENLKAGMQSV
ncbi:MAG: alpha/beta hydrolase [Pseudomonadales bacterium]